MLMRCTAAAVVGGALVAGGCSAKAPMKNPLGALGSIEEPPRVHLAAMKQLDAAPPSPEYTQALRRLIWEPGYTPDVRREALQRLEKTDMDALKRTIELRLPGMTALEWRRELCQIIADRNWTDLSPTLARAWATPAGGWIMVETERPEYLALAKMYGKDHVIDQLFVIFAEADPATQQNLKARCWELLIRLGQQQRLEELIRASDPNTKDGMLRDLRVGLVDFGIVPSNLEEILWLRQLRQPEHAEFWSQAKAAMEHVSPEVRRDMELRTVPVVVALWKFDPQVLALSKDELYRRVDQQTRSTTRHAHKVNFAGWSGDYPQTLSEEKQRLQWGDLAAMLLAMNALQNREMLSHLFDYAERDRNETSTEFGGIIALDGKGRVEVKEFPPRTRQHDNIYYASQEMFDAGYDALFHFHFHAQKYDNEGYAGPHMGDLTYADNTRANCLVFTFVDRNTMNVDFYRHEKVIVDVGEIRRPIGG
jgi:hypothetical protein